MNMSRIRKTLLPRQKRILATVGEQLRLARLRRELSASQVAERSGITLPTLYRLEKGSSSSSIATLVLVMAALGLEDDFLMLGQDDVLGRNLEGIECFPTRRDGLAAPAD